MIGEAKFVEALAGMAELTGFNLTPWVIDVYRQALEPHGLDKAVAALSKLAFSARRFPTPADILAIVAPAAVAEVTNDEEAAVASERIIGALSKFGSADVGRGDGPAWRKQREFIGELGWSVVEANGGWRHLCDSVTNDDLPTLKAQWRNEAKAHMSRAVAGRVGGPAIPGGMRAEQLVAAKPEPLALPEGQTVEAIVAKRRKPIPCPMPPPDEAW